jgi:hypothetical protein
MSIGTPLTWQGYLRRYKRESGAGLLLAIGGTTPRLTLRHIEVALVRRNIDGDQYRVRIEALEHWRALYVHAQPIVDEHDTSDWRHLGDNRYMRKTHGINS